MKTLKTSLLLTALLTLGAAAHAEVVGRVLMSAGDTSVIRDSRELRVTVGTPIEDKDTLKTGPTSNMQVRFTDESIVSLRDQSLLKIDEYKFTGKPDGMEKAFFNLLKGGFRTVTGLIGRVNKTNYGVKTATATIGIRGTHFALLNCAAGSCGAAAKDGVYGGVSGGTIAATNKTGEYQFGSGDYFHVASQDTAAKKLIGPPEFFVDHLVGQKRGGKPGTGNEQAQNGGYASNLTQSDTYSDILSLLPPAYVVTENTRSDGSPCVLTISSASCNVPGISTVSTTSTAPTVPPVIPPVIPPVVFPSQGAGGIVYEFGGPTAPGNPISGSFTSTNNQMTSFSGVDSVTPITVAGNIGSASVSDSGGNAAAGNVNWGRWSGTGAMVASPSNVTPAPTSNLHYAIGDMPTMPTSGTGIIYTSVGGTRVTDLAGTMFGSVATGSFTVNFNLLGGSMTITNLSFLFPLVNGATYTMSGSTNFSSNGQFATNFTSGSCSGVPSCTGLNIGGKYAGSFTGANAAGIAMVFKATNGPNGEILGALGFKKM